MPAYVVVQIEAVADPVEYERYKAMTPASIAAYGGRYLVRGGPCEVLEGSWRPPRLVVLEFPSSAQARAWWNSPEYAAAKRLRQACAQSEIVLIEGFAPPPATG
jgi:uncharacterized protein (DUF1330 family)